jgi:xanthine dehydrogenase accessory factor
MMKFVVSADNVFGIDEGACDPALIEQARGLLQGGAAVVIDGMFYEPVLGSDFNIAVFGAGHVGAAVVNLLSGLDCNIRWVDSRRDIFRAAPRNVRTVEASEPALEVAAMPPSSYYLVMTHSHPLDFDICDRILRRGDAAYCGLIGSLTKRRRFEKRFRQQGLPESLIGQLVCPIGVAGISGKKPAEIAIAAAAEILRVYERSPAAEQSLPGNVHPTGS